MTGSKLVVRKMFRTENCLCKGRSAKRISDKHRGEHGARGGFTDLNELK